MTKEKYPRVLDSGTALDSKPGRKFGYSEQDFIEAYFGKDLVRNQVPEENNVFGFNESLKKKYPVDKYLQMPSINAKLAQLKEKTQYFSHPSEYSDHSFSQFLSSLDLDRAETIKDTPHPTDKSRTLLKDAEMRLESYLKRKEKATGEPMWNAKEVAGIRKGLRDEYFPPKKVEEPVADTKQEEKFEPFYEGETSSSAARDDAPSDSTPTQSTSSTSSSESRP